MLNVIIRDAMHKGHVPRPGVRLSRLNTGHRNLTRGSYLWTGLFAERGKQPEAGQAARNAERAA